VQIPEIIKIRVTNRLHIARQIPEFLGIARPLHHRVLRLPDRGAECPAQRVAWVIRKAAAAHFLARRLARHRHLRALTRVHIAVDDEGVAGQNGTRLVEVNGLLIIEIIVHVLVERRTILPRTNQEQLS